MWFHSWALRLCEDTETDSFSGCKNLSQGKGHRFDPNSQLLLSENAFYLQLPTSGVGVKALLLLSSFTQMTSGECISKVNTVSSAWK